MIQVIVGVFAICSIFSLGFYAMHKIFKKESQEVKFGRWLLKNATSEFDGIYLTWVYKGSYYNTAELYDIFLDEND